jgi:hypothetical protein
MGFLGRIAFVVVLLAGVPALAQDAGAPPDMGAAMSAPADPTTDPGAFVKVVVEAAHARDYRMLTALALILVVSLARKYAPKVHGKVGAFLNTDRGGAVLVLSLAVLGGVINALVGGGALSFGMLGTAIYVSFLAAGGYSLVRKAGIMDLIRPLLSKLGLALVICACASSVFGCAWLKKHPVVAGELGCAEQAIVAAVPALLGDVAEALSGSSPDWGALLTLEEQHGPATVGCAVDQLLAQKGAYSSARAQFEDNAKMYKQDGGALGHFAKVKAASDMAGLYAPGSLK